MHFGKEMLSCAREGSAHLIAHTRTHAHTHMLTPSLKPISFAQGMGTPLISLLPLSSLPPHHPCPFAHPLVLSPSPSLPSSFTSLSITSSPCPGLAPSLSSAAPSSLTVLLSSPCALFSECLLLAHFYFLPPSVPNLS